MPEQTEPDQDAFHPPALDVAPGSRRNSRRGSLIEAIREIQAESIVSEEQTLRPRRGSLVKKELPVPRSPRKPIKGKNSNYQKLLSSHTVSDIPATHPEVIEVDSTLTPLAGFKVLLDKNILSAPVWNDSTKSYMGFLDIRDLVSSVMFASKAMAVNKQMGSPRGRSGSPGTPTRTTPRGSLSRTDASGLAISSVASPANQSISSPANRGSIKDIQVAHADANGPGSARGSFRDRLSLTPRGSGSSPRPSSVSGSPRLRGKFSWDDTMDLGIRKFAQQGEGVSLAYLAKRNAFTAVSSNTNLFEVAKQLSTGLHRIPVVDDSGKCTQIISQSSILQFLFDHREALGSQGEQTLKQLQIGLKPVMQCTATTVAEMAFGLMDNARLSGIAVVDVEGKVVGNTSARDLKYFVLDKGSLSMKMPILDYLSQIRQRDVADRAPVCCVSWNKSINAVIELMVATHYHRVFIVDKDRRPIGVVSITDLLHISTSRTEEESV